MAPAGRLSRSWASRSNPIPAFIPGTACAIPRLHPSMLTCAEIDQSLGLLLLREMHTFAVYATASVRDILRDDNSMFRMLAPRARQVEWRAFRSRRRIRGRTGMQVEAIPMGGRISRLCERRPAGRLPSRTKPSWGCRSDAAAAPALPAGRSGNRRRAAGAHGTERSGAAGWHLLVGRRIHPGVAGGAHGQGHGAPADLRSRRQLWSASPGCAARARSSCTSTTRTRFWMRIAPSTARCGRPVGKWPATG